MSEQNSNLGVRPELLDRVGYRPMQEGYSPYTQRGYIPVANTGSLPKAPTGGTGENRPTAGPVAQNTSK